jgi:hypothetical protein
MARGGLAASLRDALRGRQVVSVVAHLVCTCLVGTIQVVAIVPAVTYDCESWHECMSWHEWKNTHPAHGQAKHHSPEAMRLAQR